MTFLQPTDKPRLNEPVGFLLLISGVCGALSLVSYHPFDPSWNTAGGNGEFRNLIGKPGAYGSDLALQVLGAGAYLLPVFALVLGWCWIRSTRIERPAERFIGSTCFVLTACAGLAVAPLTRIFHDTVLPGGTLGFVAADLLVGFLNQVGAVLFLLAAAVVSVYLMTSVTIEAAVERFRGLGDPVEALRQNWQAWRESQRERASARRARRAEAQAAEQLPVLPEAGEVVDLYDSAGDPDEIVAVFDDGSSEEASVDTLPPIVPYDGARDGADDDEDDELPPFDLDSEEELEPTGDALSRWVRETSVEPAPRPAYQLPSTLLLKSPAIASVFDPEELQEIARAICAKYEEFGVKGSVKQINPGPVVTTFEFKPDPGVKYSKVTHLAEDLCLALECESILVERIPGKSTIGIEVPNREREIIVLREIIESPEFGGSSSRLTLSLGKDINGKIHIGRLDSMPHLLVAGSTGSGKSVLINSLVMSILYTSTPDQVRFIMVDPKTVELGLYADIPHLLTPVITDMKKASNALRNATREMEQRLKLLAEYGVRNIDQFNRKMERLRAEREEGAPELPPDLPCIVIIIDELADLMMVEGRQVEESITRLAQMARAAGIHLILATQRPSVDVITGLIKANIPARISFRLATRVDSRTILDAMGAESLLGRGDMLFLPPGSGRMIRLHGPLVSEEESHAVVNFWKQQAQPEYKEEFLSKPDDKEDGEGAVEDDEVFDDPAYEDAVRIVLEMGKASTSTLQRRLRLGYGRAARILDAMERDGIIGPPDGSRPREVLKSPDWLLEVERR